MNIDAYLDRIGYRGSREPTIETLRNIQAAHFYSVPFENLDISLGRRIEDHPVPLALLSIPSMADIECYSTNCGRAQQILGATESR